MVISAVLLREATTACPLAVAMSPASGARDAVLDSSSVPHGARARNKSTSAALCSCTACIGTSIKLVNKPLLDAQWPVHSLLWSPPRAHLSSFALFAAASAQALILGSRARSQALIRGVQSPYLPRWALSLVVAAVSLPLGAHGQTTSPTASSLAGTLAGGLKLVDGVRYVCPPVMEAGCWVTLSVVGGGGGAGTLGPGGVGGAVSVTFLLGGLNPTLTSIFSATGGGGVSSFGGGGGAGTAVYTGTTLLAVAGGGGGGGYVAATATGGAGGITSPGFAGANGGTSGTPTGGGGATQIAAGAGSTGGSSSTGTAGTGGGSFFSPGVGAPCPTAGCAGGTVTGGGVGAAAYPANGGAGCTGGTKGAGGGGGGFYGGGSGGTGGTSVCECCRPPHRLATRAGTH